MIHFLLLIQNVYGLFEPVGRIQVPFHKYGFILEQTLTFTSELVMHDLVNTKIELDLDLAVLF